MRRNATMTQWHGLMLLALATTASVCLADAEPSHQFNRQLNRKLNRQLNEQLDGQLDEQELEHNLSHRATKVGLPNRRPNAHNLHSTVMHAMHDSCWSGMGHPVRGRKTSKIVSTRNCEGGGTESDVLVTYTHRNQRELGMVQVACDGSSIDHVVCGASCQTDDDCATGTCYMSPIVGYKVCGSFAAAGDACDPPGTTVAAGEMPNKCEPTSVCVSAAPSTTSPAGSDGSGNEGHDLGVDPVDNGDNLDVTTNGSGHDPIDLGGSGEGTGGDNDGTPDVYDLPQDVIDAYNSVNVNTGNNANGNVRRRHLAQRPQQRRQARALTQSSSTAATCREICDDDSCGEGMWCRITSVAKPSSLAQQLDPTAPPPADYSACAPYAAIGDVCEAFTTPEFYEVCDPDKAACVKENRAIADGGGKCRQKCTTSNTCPSGEMCGDDGICLSTCNTDADCTLYQGPNGSASTPSDVYWCRSNEIDTTGLCTPKAGSNEPCTDNIPSTTPWKDNKCANHLACTNGVCA